MVDHCALCQSERIPGIGSCANCGEPWPREAVRFVLGTIELPPPDAPLPDYYTPPTSEGALIMRAINEARALEYAGDVDTAMGIYERLTQTRTLAQMPYQRLAVLYRKRKAWADEERVVRLALAHIPSGPNSWFVLRLAKILGELAKGKR